MTRRLAATLIVLGGCLALGGDIARACGDKFLIFGGSPSSRPWSAIHPSTILVVQRSSKEKLVVNDSRLEAFLERSGHRVTVISSQAVLAQTLATGKYDAVLVDLADAGAGTSQAAASTTRPLLVTLLSDPSAAELAASQEYACLQAQDKPRNFLKGLDDFLAQRKAARKAAQ